MGAAAADACRGSCKGHGAAQLRQHCLLLGQLPATRG